MSTKTEEQLEQKHTSIDTLAKKAMQTGVSYRKVGETLGIVDRDTIRDITARMYELRVGGSLEQTQDSFSFTNHAFAHQFPNENHVGATQIPVGIVGPVTIKRAGHLTQKSLEYLMTTTEESMIGGANFAAKLVSAAGGVEVTAYKTTNRIARSSIFKIDDFFRFEEYRNAILSRKNELQQKIQAGHGNMEGSSFAVLTDLDVLSEDDCAFVRYTINPGDAAGHNMVTKVAQILNMYLKEKLGQKGLPFNPIILSGGVCKDKNSAAINYDRGIKYQARARIPRKLCDSLRVPLNPEALVDASFAKNYLGQSVAGGMRGNNSSVANPYTAMALAYGQDPANVVEGSQARTVFKLVPFEEAFTDEELSNMSAKEYKALKANDVLEMSVNGNIVCGTIGGGTVFPTQQEALAALGLNGSDPNNPGLYKARLAEVFATGFLLSELAVHHSLTSGENGVGSRHAAAHKMKYKKK